MKKVSRFVLVMLSVSFTVDLVGFVFGVTKRKPRAVLPACDLVVEAGKQSMTPGTSGLPEEVASTRLDDNYGWLRGPAKLITLPGARTGGEKRCST